jgi:hypothetical protein
VCSLLRKRISKEQKQEKKRLDKKIKEKNSKRE